MTGKPYVGEMSWRGLQEGVPNLLRRLAGVTDPSGSPVRFTWLLRSDYQMAQLYGDPAYVAIEFQEFWRERIRVGDEIGWHPHAWRDAATSSIWYQECRDVDWVRTCLHEGHNRLSRHFPIRTAKPGWTYHDNRTMATFSELGVEVDLSALPGMRYSGTVPGTNLPLGSYDWSRAPQEPYHPRRDDYQVPGLDRALPILEVPNWTFPLQSLRATYHRIRGRSERDFANVAKLPQLVRGGFRRPPRTVPFVCYFHPEELLGRGSRLFHLENAVRNLTALISAAQDFGLTPRMTVASQILGGG